MEKTMCKSLVTVAAALVALSMGSLVSDRAQAAGAMSAPSRHSHATHSASLDQVRNNRLTQTVDFRITEFSSSSAKSSVPKR